MDKEVILKNFMGNIWLKRIVENKKDYMDMVNICIRLEDASFVNIGVLYYYDNIYYLGKEPIGTIDDISFLSYIEKITGINKSKEHADTIKSAPKKPSVSSEEVCEDYQNTNSVEQTAKNLGMSKEKAKKILITAGVYTSKRYMEIKELLEKGKTLDEIAEQLQIAKKQVYIFVPYTNKQ